MRAGELEVHGGCGGAQSGGRVPHADCSHRMKASKSKALGRVLGLPGCRAAGLPDCWAAGTASCAESDRDAC